LERSVGDDDALALPPEADIRLVDGELLVPPDRATRSLWKEAGRIWDRYHDKRDFHSFVAADYAEVYRALVQLRGRVTTVLEWGSGLGVVTIMASNLGFEAYGIESESGLVDCSRVLAASYGREARFAAGSFIPAEYEWDPEAMDDTHRSDVEAEPGYDELGMDLQDFDLVYAFPWPDELLLFQDIIRKCARDDTLFLWYDAREGIQLSRCRHLPLP
jgi:hypothetical protein